MSQKPILDQLVRQLMQVIPPELKELPKALEEQFRHILQSAFIDMDLVTRAEFDAQVRVLARLQQQLKQLETLIAPSSLQKKSSHDTTSS